LGTPEDIARAVEAAEAKASRSEAVRDQLTLLAGTGQNILGLAVFMIATFGISILIARAFGKGSAAFGQITLVTQLAFVAGAATRFGMDMAAVRRVAIEVGRNEPGRSRAIVRLAVWIALVVSVTVAAVVSVLAEPVARLLNTTAPAIRAGAVALIFVALTQVYLGGSRGLKIMRYTLYAYWVGQSISWIVLTVALWGVFGRSVAVTVEAYALSWVVASAIALVTWRWRSNHSNASGNSVNTSMSTRLPARPRRGTAGRRRSSAGRDRPRARHR
jgi:O-antigen/teichoic acid export membrane protein